MDHIVAIAPAKINQIREAGRKVLAPQEFERLNELLNQLMRYGLTPFINRELGSLMARFGWELEVAESPEWAEALIACDVAFLGSELKEMCRETGMSDYGHKKELCRRLYRANVQAVVAIMKPIIEKGSVNTSEQASYLREKQFVKVGDRVRYKVHSPGSKYRQGDWPVGVWLGDKPVLGTVTEYHPSLPALHNYRTGESIEALAAWAVVKWDNGASSAIDSEKEGEIWERV